MLRFTKRADYGLMAIHYIAIHDDLGAVSAKRIAEEFSIPQELLAKILQRLAKQGLIVSTYPPLGPLWLTISPCLASRWRIFASNSCGIANSSAIRLALTTPSSPWDEMKCIAINP